jgi:spermidine/putrescine-binding protein
MDLNFVFQWNVFAGEENLNEVEDEEKLEADFEAYKSKVYSLTVPLKLVALRGSVPPSWIKEFMSSQGKRVRLKTQFRGNLEEIFFDLSKPSKNGKKGAASTAAADMISIGDSWLSFAIKEKLIEPMKGIEDQDWYKGLSDKWKIYLRRNYAGEKAPDGETWAVPYRWGTMVIAYKKSKFQNYKLAPIEDWADLWRPELAGRIAMVNSPREVVGAVLKYMRASYNTTDLDSQVPGGRLAVEKNLASLMKQIRLFDSNNYLKAFNVGDVWVTVGWSSDVIPVAKRMSNVTVIVPKSGATLWADLWAIPAVSDSGKEAEQRGGRVRGPSPLINQWIEFCLQPARSLPFTREVIPGASPSALDGPLVTEPEKTKKDRTKLDTNLVTGVPPPEILSKCEFLEPLPEATLSEYRLLIETVRKQSQRPGLVEKLKDIVSIKVRGFRAKLDSEMNKNI